jgi:hypothetical protein
MPEPEFIISITLALVGAALLILVLLEMTSTAWLGFAGCGTAFWLTRRFYPLGWKMVCFAGREIQHRQVKNLYFWGAGWLLLGLLKILWAGMIIGGFACLYLAVTLPETVIDLSSENWRRHIFQAVAFGFLVHAPPDSNETLAGQPMGFMLLTAAQKLTVFVYLAVTAAETMLVYRQSKRMHVELYEADEEFKKSLPFALARHLSCNFGSCRLKVILTEWQLWAGELEMLLRAYPALPYLRTADGYSWILSLEIVLQGTAEIQVAGNEPVKHSARAAFAAARRAVVQSASLCGGRTSGRMLAKTLEEKEVKTNDDVILSAEFIEEIDKSCSCPVGEREMLEVWQFTYQSSLVRLKSYFALDSER